MDLTRYSGYNGEVYMPIAPLKRPGRRTPGPEIMRILDQTPGGNHMSDPSLKDFFEFEANANNRLESFSIGNWPHADIISLTPEEMAEAGFFYLLKEDKVQCPFCEVIISNWQQGHDPLLRHQEVNPFCKFIQGYNVQNIPIKEDPVRGSVRRLRCHDYPSSYPFSRPSAMNIFNQPSISQVPNGHPQPVDMTPPEAFGSSINNRSGPKYPNYGSLAARLESYRCPIWLESCPISPERLSQAGFFFNGTREVRDAVRCFSCGHVVCRWEPNDNPWDEHKKFSPHCEFLTLNHPSTQVDVLNRINHNQSSGSSSYCSDLTGQTSEEAMETGSKPFNSQLSTGSSSGCESDEEMLTRKADSEPKLSSSQESSSSSSSRDSRITCVVCWGGERAVAFMPCHHMVTCTRCAPALTNCPVCRQKITQSLRLFLS